MTYTRCSFYKVKILATLLLSRQAAILYRRSTKSSALLLPRPRRSPLRRQSSCLPHKLPHIRVRSSDVPYYHELIAILYLEKKVTGVAAAASIKLPSPAPASVPALPQRTRHAQQSHRPSPARGRQAQPEPPGPDEDAEGEDDVEEGNGDDDEDNEDKTLYCFCQKMSYGEVCVT